MRYAMWTAAMSVCVMAVVLGGCSEKPTPSAAGGHGGEAASTGKTVEVVNSICPIMGTPIDPKAVPESLTVMFEGQRVGFCCGMCPPKWKALTEDEKREKLMGVQNAAQSAPMTNASAMPAMGD